MADLACRPVTRYHVTPQAFHYWEVPAPAHIIVLDADMGRDSTLLKQKPNLDECRHAGRGLPVADVCLNGTTVQWLLRHTSLSFDWSKNIRNGLHLFGIPSLSTSAVKLDEADFERVNTSPRQHLSVEVSLMTGMRMCDGNSISRMVGSGGWNDT